MKLREWLRRLGCSDCIDAPVIDRLRVLTMQERTGDALDRIGEELRRIRVEMADGANPVLGERPERKERA